MGSTSSSPVTVFISSGEASLLERKVLMYSLRRNSRRDLDIRVFNGTHNTIEREGHAPEPAPMSLKVKYQNVTEFSNYRFLVPAACGHRGRAISMDSDVIALGDIGELFDAEMGNRQLLAKPAAYGDQTDEQWGLSVMLVDCDQTRFALDQYFDEIEAGLYDYTDLHQMRPRFLAHHPFKIGRIDPRWNEFDRRDKDTRLIHYTNLYAQPWKFRSHPYGDLWFEYFDEARKAGFVTERDIELTLVRAYARKDLLEGNRWTLASYLRRMGSDLKSELRCIRAARLQRR
ncbi:MAG: glycosyl transferase [Hydrogenophaga sp.]|nr:glycosyl transferase [Hydrogenophaga sp.]